MTGSCRLLRFQDRPGKMPFGALRPGAVRQAPGAAFVERDPVGVSKTRGGAEPRNVGGKQPWHKGFVVALAMLHHRQVPERIAGAGEVEEAQQSAGRKDPCAFRRSEEHTSELQSLMRISYAVFCLKKK